MTAIPAAAAPRLTRSARLVLLAFLLAACARGAPSNAGRTVDSAAAPAARTDTAHIAETFITPFDTLDNVDSPAVYHAGDVHWLLASAKTTDAILVYDATTGAPVRRVGTSGTSAGALRRPNGLAVADSTLFVVERDNHRVQAFHLPSFRPLGTFATGLRKPYGLTWVRAGGGGYRLYVTDNYETADEQVPPDHELGRRVHLYEVRLTPQGVEASLLRTFGDTVGDGTLRIVESIMADSVQGRLLVAEETEVDSHLKLYDLEGRFGGRIVGRGRFPQQAEGIALYACADGGGYWIATDQGEGVNTFHVFDRKTLDHLGAFTGEETRLTDGVALTQRAFGPFAAGALYASHLDGGIAALSWAAIAEALGLRSDCRT